jgi:Ala-tRNA(Pro) deacylase
MAKTVDELFLVLEGLGIETRTHAHPPLFTVAESRAMRGEIPGRHCKNLFVRDRGKAYFLIVLEEDSRIDLKTLHEWIGARGKVSFGSAEALLELWGVTPGSVTPFGAINDPEGRVQVVLGARLASAPAVNLHPLENNRTTTISGPELIRFLRACGHEPLLLHLPEA